MGVTACASAGSGSSAHTRMSDSEYLKVSETERVAYRDQLKSDTNDLAAKWQSELEAYLDVRTGDARTGTTIQCSWVPGSYNLINVYPGHNPPGMSGAASEGFLTLVADKKCQPYYAIAEDGTPSVVRLLSNVAAQEDIARVMAKGGFQVAGSLFSGVGAQALANAKDCDGCGTTFNVAGGSAAAGAALDNTNVIGVDTGVHVVNTPSGPCGRRACTDYDTE